MCNGIYRLMMIYIKRESDMKKIKILIVEDEAIVARCLSMVLELEGYEVCDYVATGKEAIQKSIEQNPDLILMDINLRGEMDGITAMENIRRQQKIPVIFMTGYSGLEYSVRAEKLQPLAYFKKPIEVELITPVIREYFKDNL